MTQLQDLSGVIRGLQKVVQAGVQVQEKEAINFWNNCSLKSLLSKPINISTNTNGSGNILDALSSEGIARASLVAKGFRQFASLHVPDLSAASPMEHVQPEDRAEIEDLNKQFMETFQNMTIPEINPPIESSSISKRFDKERDKISSRPLKAAVITQPEASTHLQQESVPVKPVALKKLKQCLGENSKARVVPSSRISRMFSFGSLAAGLGVGTVTEYARTSFQSLTGKTKESDSIASAFLSPANAERIVDTLCKVRGAALKLGQLLSIQDESVISPEMQRIFERVRKSADFMPMWQVERVMTSQLGSDWYSKLKSFEQKPFAAASIGQVHLGVLHDGTEVAIKIQYPGVAKGIDSDIDNLVGVLKVWNIFPKGMFIDNIVEVAKKELAWEVDYLREKECTKKFKELLAPYPEYYVPAVVEELCAAEVMTTELIYGQPIDRMFDADYEIRHDIAKKIMQLCLREMFEFLCMQTDPNWANFFYNTNNGQIILLDFGATREYSKEFMDQYIEMIKAASVGDRDMILRLSKDLKFLTGYESKIMEETHIDTVMIMGEVFTNEQHGEFDFGTQRTTRRIQNLVPTILNHRLCPPPEEIYSLHRKLSGVFLLCSKLKVKLDCRTMFEQIYDVYKSKQ